MTQADAIYWIRHDLRLRDNPALSAAAEQGRVLPVFIWSPAEEGDWPLGGAAKWWLHHSLAALDSALRERGSRLVIRSGPAQEVLEELIAQTRASYVAWNRRYEPAIIHRDKQVKQSLLDAGIEVESFNAALLNEPWTIKTQSGTPYKVFTPYWKTCLDEIDQVSPLPIPRNLQPLKKWPAGEELKSLGLLPQIHWDGGLEQAWEPGEATALKRLKKFCKSAVLEYQEGRNRIDVDGSSQLSAHLRFGELSPRQVWRAVTQAFGDSRQVAPDRDVYLAEIGWREFSYHLLYHFPETTTRPLRENFQEFPWQSSEGHLRAWQRGQTGVPIVDAAMRHLWHEGWMPNRARMIVASYLTKNLRIAWQEGARWFWDTLVDADLASNTQGWQWTAGCGADAAPYFRIFNPVSQADKHDPHGDYIRRWVPELSELKTPWLFKPWEADEEMLSEAGVELGRTYPLPLVDLKESREAALDAYQSIRS
jgi:deoxyribodipyrimidine photo-lyase